MGNIARFIMLVATFMAISITAEAQNADKKKMTREQLADVQARHIAQQIGLDDATTEKFTDAYGRCQKEIWALGQRPKRQRGQTMTDAETEQALKQRFEHSQKILDIRQKYYKEYSKFLTQKQIQRAYQIEKQMMKRLSNKQKPRRNRGRR